MLRLLDPAAAATQVAVAILHVLLRVGQLLHAADEVAARAKSRWASRKSSRAMRKSWAASRRLQAPRALQKGKLRGRSTLVMPGRRRPRSSACGAKPTLLTTDISTSIKAAAEPDRPRGDNRALSVVLCREP
jgi:hypothetical protein